MTHPGVETNPEHSTAARRRAIHEIHIKIKRLVRSEPPWHSACNVGIKVAPAPIDISWMTARTVHQFDGRSMDEQFATDAT